MRTGELATTVIRFTVQGTDTHVLVDEFLGWARSRLDMGEIQLSDDYQRLVVELTFDQWVEIDLLYSDDRP